MTPGGNPVTEVPGLSPRLPEIVEEPVLVTVVPARIAKVLAVPIGTDEGELVVAKAGWLVLTIPATIMTEPMTIGATNAADLRIADILREMGLSIICRCFYCRCLCGSG